jgi:inosine/xanthosine triphosphatase
MKKIIVTSLNPVKTEAVLRGFQRCFPSETFEIVQVGVESGVAVQPISDEETLLGARTRAQNGKAVDPEGDYWVGVEGGCDFMGGEMVSFAWVIVLDNHREGSSRTALFRLPKPVQTLVEGGLELGDADDQVFGRENSKQKSGAVGLLTGDVVTRTDLYEQAVILALIPFRNQDLYEE